MLTQDLFSDLPLLHTDRLLLRKMTINDASDLFEYASDPEVAKYSTWNAHSNLEDTTAFLHMVEHNYASGQPAGWGIVHKAVNKFIGTCGYANWSQYHNRAEIGYALSRAYWNQGLMTEAARAVIQFGFDHMQLNRVEARCKVENIGSERVLQKVGMSYEGLLREHMLVKDSYQDLKLYSILKSEFAKV